jgi:hypothetical protein
MITGRTYYQTSGCHRGVAPDDQLRGEKIVRPLKIILKARTLAHDFDIVEKEKKTLQKSNAKRDIVGTHNTSPPSSRKQTIEDNSMPKSDTFTDDLANTYAWSRTSIISTVAGLLVAMAMVTIVFFGIAPTQDSPNESTDGLASHSHNPTTTTNGAWFGFHDAQANRCTTGCAEGCVDLGFVWTGTSDASDYQRWTNGEPNDWDSSAVDCHETCSTSDGDHEVRTEMHNSQWNTFYRFQYACGANSKSRVKLYGLDHDK